MLNIPISAKTSIAMATKSAFSHSNQNNEKMKHKHFQMKPSPIHHEDEITFEADIFGFGDVGK
jgi:hypothetical protein